MDETKSENEIGSESKNEETKPVSGTEINVGDFTRTQGMVKSMRLVLNDQIVVQVEEIASGLSEAGRTFKMGNIEQANQDVTRLYAAFGRKTAQWESQARNLEQQMRMQTAKNPKAISIDKMNRMKSEQIAVRTRIRTAEIQFRRLHQGLNTIFTILQRQPAPQASETSTTFPAGFLVPFKAATSDDRQEIVKRVFEIEAVVKVSVSKRTDGTYDVKFDPMPPLNRLYFLTKTAQIVQLQKLGKAVLIDDLETGVSSEMKLVEFVKHVQNGVWLLKPGS